MKTPLAVFTPAIGNRSETFIRRHVQDLLPGHTAVISATVVGQDGWRLNGELPILNLEDIWRSFSSRALTRIIRNTRLPLRSAQQRRVERFLKQNNVEVILGEYLDKSLWLLPIAKRLGIRFFAHAHGYDVSSKLTKKIWREEYLKYNHADGVIAMSNACAERLAELGIERSRIHVIYSGVDVPDGPVAKTDSEPVRCLAVGRMVAKKAPIITLDAFRRAVERFPQMRLDYIGGGGLLSAARQFVSAFGLEDKVTLHGSQPHHEVNRLLASADIFLQHSMTDPDSGDEEGLPVGILEAMANCVPVVSTYHAGIPEAVIDGSTGSLVTEGDSATMADRIVDLALSFSRRQAMGQAGRNRVKDQFTWESEREALLEVMGLRNLEEDHQGKFLGTTEAIPSKY